MVTWAWWNFFEPAKSYLHESYKVGEVYDSADLLVERPYWCSGCVVGTLVVLFHDYVQEVVVLQEIVPEFLACPEPFFWGYLGKLVYIVAIH